MATTTPKAKGKAALSAALSDGPDQPESRINCVSTRPGEIIATVMPRSFTSVCSVPMAIMWAALLIFIK